MNQADLADLQAFAAVADARSFRGAAAVGGVSASALSEAVRRLEARLNVRLLNRTTRSVTPTEAGTRLLERLAPALGEVASALDAVSSLRDSPSGRLRLNVPSVVARVVLPPLVSGFLEAHPGFTVEVMAEDSLVDVLAAGFDAGVRYGERLEKDMIAVPIGPRMQRFALAASPAYLAARGRPKHPRELVSHTCLRHRFASGVEPSMEFERNGRKVRISPKGPLVTNMIDLQIAAALRGVGMVYSFEEWLAADMASGQLEPVLPEWWESFPGPFLYYPSRRHMPAALRAFVDYIKNRSQRGAGAGSAASA